MNTKKHGPNLKNSLGAAIPGGGLQDFRPPESTRPLSKGGRKNQSPHAQRKVNDIGAPVPKGKGL